MNFHILTLFPEMVMDGLNTSIIGRAVSAGRLSIEAVNIRDYAFNKHQSVDDYPYGGGAGMLMQAEPVYLAYKAVAEKICAGGEAVLDGQDAYGEREQFAGREPDDRPASGKKRPRVVYLSPQGEVFNQKMAEEMAREEDLILLCGHYEGIDERITDYVDEMISIGDFILTGGEIPSLAIADSITRLLKDSISEESLLQESFDSNLLEYPQYTSPYDFEGKKVPDILYSGNHKAIEKWRRKQSLLLTKKYRKDLFDKLTLSKEDKTLLEEENDPSWEQEAVNKGKKFIKD